MSNSDDMKKIEPQRNLSNLLVSGYTVCGLYPSETSGKTVFDPRLTNWIATFYSIAFVQSLLTTGFMAYKIWRTDRQSAGFRTQESHLLPIVRILIESAALQLFVEVLLLALYAANYNAQYILLEIVTPLVVSVSSRLYRDFGKEFHTDSFVLVFLTGNHLYSYYYPNHTPYVWSDEHYRIRTYLHRGTPSEW